MGYFVPEKLHHDLARPAIVASHSLPWTPSPLPGVERRFLERDGGEVARATSIVRYAAGSRFDAHRHDKGEEYLVLAGVFSDEHGDHPAGSYVRNPPGSRHAPFTRDGCTIFVKLRQMPDSEHDTLAVDSATAPLRLTRIAGLARLKLYVGGGEKVAIERLAPGTAWRGRRDVGGEEILVLDGSLRYGGDEYGSGSWLRIPAGSERPLGSTGGCRIWVKRGHLNG